MLLPIGVPATAVVLGLMLRRVIMITRSPLWWRSVQIW